MSDKPQTTGKIIMSFIIGWAWGVMTVLMMVYNATH